MVMAMTCVVQLGTLKAYVEKQKYASLAYIWATMLINFGLLFAYFKWNKNVLYFLLQNILFRADFSLFDNEY